jgi:carboxymethylenebutenolidase
MGQKTAIFEAEVELRATDGATVPAFAAGPEGVADAPRILIAPEIFGLSPWIRSVARRLAHEGFRAIAPEIFVRDTEPMASGMEGMMARMGRLDMPQAVRDLRTALDHFRGGKAGSIGFCLGGALSILSAAEGGLSACVSCYGRPRWARPTPAPHAIDAVKRVACPVLGIYGKRDKGIPAAQAQELAALFPPGSELALYDAGHAFLNDTRPEMYVEDQAALAWGKIIGFLRRNLS